MPTKIPAPDRSHLATPTTKSYVLTTLAKLTSRFGYGHLTFEEASSSEEGTDESCKLLVVYCASGGSPSRANPVAPAMHEPAPAVLAPAAVE